MQFKFRRLCGHVKFPKVRRQALANVKPARCEGDLRIVRLLIKKCIAFRCLLVRLTTQVTTESLMSGKYPDGSKSDVAWDTVGYAPRRCGSVTSVV